MDGLPAPEVVDANTARFVSYAYSELCAAALGPGFDFARIDRTTVAEYEMWTLLMARVYETLNATDTMTKTKWAVRYFEKAAADDPDLLEAERVTGVPVKDSYRFDLIWAVSVEQQEKIRCMCMRSSIGR